MELFWIITTLTVSIGILFSHNPTGSAGESVKEEAAKYVARVRNGDQQAFARIVELFEKRMYHLALTYVKDMEEARDLTQDIFVTVYKALPQLKDDLKFSAWVYQIGLNHCRNRYKSLKNKGFFSSQSLDDPCNYLQLRTDSSPEKILEKNNMIQLVHATIDAMSETEKEILVLRDIQELGYDEISTILDIPLGTVKSKLNRARTTLKNKIQHLL